MVKNKTCLAVVLTVKHYRKELQSFCWHLPGSRGIQGKSYLLLLKAGEFERGKIGPFISDFTWILFNTLHFSTFVNTLHFSTF